MTEYADTSPAVTYQAPAPVIEHAEPAVTDTASASADVYGGGARGEAQRAGPWSRNKQEVVARERSVGTQLGDARIKGKVMGTLVTT